MHTNKHDNMFQHFPSLHAQYQAHVISFPLWNSHGYANSLQITTEHDTAPYYTIVNDDSWHGSWTSSVDQKICDSCRNDVPLQAVLEAPCGNIPILAQPEEVELNLQTGDTSVQTEFTGH